MSGGGGARNRDHVFLKDNDQPAGPSSGTEMAIGFRALPFEPPHGPPRSVHVSAGYDSER
jgi:hypothetical protein